MSPFYITCIRYHPLQYPYGPLFFMENNIRKLPFVLYIKIQALLFLLWGTQAWCLFIFIMFFFHRTGIVSESNSAWWRMKDTEGKTYPTGIQRIEWESALKYYWKSRGARWNPSAQQPQIISLHDTKNEQDTTQLALWIFFFHMTFS